jgi:hypothetical protein
MKKDPIKVNPDREGWTCAEHSLHELNEHLKRIAEANKDEFRVQICVVNQGPLVTKFWVAVTETADDHTISEEIALTITEAVTAIRAGLADTCAEWNYVYVP